MNNEIAAKLAEIYYNPRSPGGYSSPKRLYREAKRVLPNLTQALVDYWFSKQEVPGRFRQAKKKFPRSIFITRQPNEEWLADLADFQNLAKFNKNYKWLCIIQDLFSRKIIALTAQKRKTSAETAKTFESVFEVQKCKILFTDQGTEFKGECKKVFEKFSIKHVTSKDVTQKAAPVERMLLVVKQKLFKIMATNKNFVWIHSLDDVLHAINNSFNRSIGMTPEEANLAENQNAVFYNSVTRPETKQYAKTLKRKEKFGIGDIVRILKDQAYSKSYVGNFSQVLYVIYKEALKGGVRVYYLRELLSNEKVEGIFYSAELQHVRLDGSDKLPKIEKIHAFRLRDNIEEVQVSYEGDKKKTWVPYSNLIVYD